MTEQSLFDCRNAFAATLVELADQDDRVVAVCNDSVGSSKLGTFREKYPERLINVGIAEQNMVGVAAGLANSGLIPFVCSASCFLTGRALEQIKVDAAYSNANIKLCGMSPGMAYGQLGPTHHSIEDIAWLRAIANLSIIVPSDPVETSAMVRLAKDIDGPVFLRIPRMGVPRIFSDEQAFSIGQANRIEDGGDLTIFAMGTLVNQALKAREDLKSEGIEARVVNLSSISPIDHREIVSAARETGAIIAAEEHTRHGGLGSAIAEIVSQEHPVPMRFVSVPNVFAPTGDAEFLHTYFGLDAKGICAAARELMELRG